MLSQSKTEMKVKMRTCFRFPPVCMFIMLLITCHKFPSSNAGESGEIEGDSHAHTSRLGESPIGPQYRQRRSERELYTNEVDDADGQKDLGQSDKNQEEDDDDDDDENDDDGQDENDDDGQDENDYSNSQASNLEKNLDFLKNTRKSLGRYIREDSSHLDQLMSESSELAKEVGLVFHKLAKREAGLEKEMESLKEALNGAVVTLKNTIREDEKIKELSEKKNDGESEDEEGESSDAKETQTLPRQRRHFISQKNPYRACVNIEPISDEEYYGGSGSSSSSKLSSASSMAGGYNEASSSSQTGQWPPATVQKYMPPRKGLPLIGQSSEGEVNVNYQNGNNVQSQQSSVNYPSSSSYQESKVTYSSGNNPVMPPGPGPGPRNNGVPPPPPPPPIPRPLPITAHSQASYFESQSSQVRGQGQAPAQNPQQMRSGSESQYQSSQYAGQGQGQAQNSQQMQRSESSRFQSQSQQQQQASQAQVTVSNANTNMNGMDEVDLSEVYWLRLDPARRQEMLHKKLDALLKNKQNQGKDVLVIPLNHGLHNTDEVKDGFLRAVRIRPNALKKNKILFRKLRSLRVMEL